MKDNTPTLNTIEDLVNVALWGGDTRYTLSENTRYEYGDPVAGKKWEDEKESVIGKYVGYGKEGYREYQEREDAYRELMPAKHPVKEWCLRVDYDTKYFLSPELGAQIDAVWTKKETRYSRTPERTGLLTLAGILKRLRRTDVAQKIKDAETARKEANEKYARNNIRRQVKQYLDTLEKYVTSYCAPIGVTADMFQLPVELAEKLKEEE